MNVSSEKAVEDVIAKDIIVPIIFCLCYPGYLLLCLSCDPCFMLDEWTKPHSECAYSSGIYTVSNMKTQRVRQCDCCTLFGNSICYSVLYQFASFIAFFLDMSIPEFRFYFYLICEMFAFLILFCCYKHFILFDSEISCDQVIPEIRNQKVELLIYTSGTLQSFTSSAFHFEDVSYFENLPQTDQNEGKLVKFDVKVCVKIHPGNYFKKLDIQSKCVLQNRRFDPNSINYRFISKPRKRPTWTLSGLKERLRLCRLGTVGKCVWKRSVHKSTLHIIKSVYIPTSLFEENVKVHIRIQDLNMDLLARVQENTVRVTIPTVEDGIDRR